MGRVESQAFKSTIGRTDEVVARPFKLHAFCFAAHCRRCRRRLAALHARCGDPLGIVSDLEGLGLDDGEILADLEHGRD